MGPMRDGCVRTANKKQRKRESRQRDCKANSESKILISEKAAEEAVNKSYSQKSKISKVCLQVTFYF